MSNPGDSYTQEQIDHDMGLDDQCGNCFGRGWVASCFEEFACIDPEEGCDDCLRPCDWCNTGRPPRPDDINF
jgi:hypothetical protein